jgi:glutaredoxin
MTYWSAVRSGRLNRKSRISDIAEQDHPVGLLSARWFPTGRAVGVSPRVGSTADRANVSWVPTILPRIVLYTRPGCHLCEAAREVVEKVSADLGESYEERDITADPDLLRTYVESIPVVEVDGVQVDFWRVSEDRLRAALRR